MNKINPTAKQHRRKFRILGWILLFCGIVLATIGRMESKRKYNDFSENSKRKLAEFGAESSRKLAEFRKRSNERFEEFRKHGSFDSIENIEPIEMESNSKSFPILQEDKEESKVYFTWLSSLGSFMVFGGIVCLILGYIGAILRYKAGELAPVAKDTVNYMGNETKEGVSDFSEALFSGLGKNAKNSSVKDRIHEIEGLYKDGVITKEEYQKQRENILKSI